jgi:hypothetical protein
VVDKAEDRRGGLKQSPSIWGVTCEPILDKGTEGDLPSPVTFGMRGLCSGTGCIAFWADLGEGEPKKQERKAGIAGQSVVSREIEMSIDEEALMRETSCVWGARGARQMKEGDETFSNTSRRVICGIGTIGLIYSRRLFRSRKVFLGRQKGGCECLIIGAGDDVT